jgi:hypothetical protein
MFTHPPAINDQPLCFVCRVQIDTQCNVSYILLTGPALGFWNQVHVVSFETISFFKWFVKINKFFWWSSICPCGYGHLIEKLSQKSVTEAVIVYNNSSFFNCVPCSTHLHAWEITHNYCSGSCCETTLILF